MRLLAIAVLLIVTVSCAPPSAETAAPGGNDTQRTAELVAPGVTPEEGQQAVDVALRDERLQDLLATHPFRVAEVSEPTGPTRSGLVVTVEFDEPLEAAYPLDMCAIETEEQPISGVVWLVEGDQVSAVSPRWGEDIACGY